MMMKPVYILKTTSIHPVGQAGVSCLSAVEPDYKELIPNPTLRRRMSRIVKMGVACGLACLENMAAEDVHAIITATGLGCLVDTEKFLNTLIDNEERMLNPTPFIQSTFNTIGAQIALLRKIHAYNVTYVHRGFSFESALLDGMMRIKEGNKQVLVGAVDEITETSFHIHQRLGLLRGVQMGEGAQFFLLSAEREPDCLAELLAVDTFSNPYSAEKVVARIETFLSRVGITPSDIAHVFTGENGNVKHDALYPQVKSSLFADIQATVFKNQCGEYPVATAFALYKAVRDTDNLLSHGDYTLLYNNHQANHTLLLIRKCL